MRHREKGLQIGFKGKNQMNIKADIENIKAIIVGLISSNTHNFGNVEEVIDDLQSAAIELIDDHTTCLVTDSFWVAQSLSDSLSNTAAHTVCHRQTEYEGARGPV